MQAPHLVTPAEYLSTAYSPDCDYIDGEVVERNLGEREHSTLQMAILAWLFIRRSALGIHVFPEQRVQVSPTRYLVPDICVLTGEKPRESIFTRPPFLCVEIISPEDRMSRVERRIGMYLAFGIKYVWLVDPYERLAWIYTRENRLAAEGQLQTREPTIEMPLGEIFAELD